MQMWNINEILYSTQAAGKFTVMMMLWIKTVTVQGNTNEPISENIQDLIIHGTPSLTLNQHIVTVQHRLCTLIR